MRRRSIFLVAALLLPLGFEAQASKVEGGDKKSTRRSEKKAVESAPKKLADSEESTPGERNACDTLTGIQEL